MADDNNIPTRLALLEQSAGNTATALADIRSDLRAMRAETHADLSSLRADLHAKTDSLRSDLTRIGNRTAGLTGITSILAVAIIAILISQFALWQQIGKLDGQMTAISAQLGEITTLLRQRTGG